MLLAHLVLVGLGLGDGLAVVGVPLDRALGEALALAVLHHVDPLGAGRGGVSRGCLPAGTSRSSCRYTSPQAPGFPC